MDQDKVFVVNQFNSDNLGDKLLNMVLCDNLEDHNFYVRNLGFAQTYEQNLCYEDNRIQKFNGIINSLFPENLKFGLKYKKRLMNETKNVSTSDYKSLIIGGGQLLKHNSVFLDCLEYWVNWGYDKNLLVCIFGVGVDNNLTNKETEKLKSILNKVDFINCRDIQSKNYLNNILPSKNILLSPDIAFTVRCSIKDIKDNTILVMPYSYVTAKKSFNIKISREEYYHNILNSFISMYPEYKVLLCATTTADVYECMYFSEFLFQHSVNSKLIRLAKVEQLVQYISSAKYIVTGRMHAMILADVCHTNIIPIKISNKIERYLSEYSGNPLKINNIINDSYNGVNKLVHFIRENCT